MNERSQMITWILFKFIFEFISFLLLKVNHKEIMSNMSLTNKLRMLFSRMSSSVLQVFTLKVTNFTHHRFTVVLMRTKFFFIIKGHKTLVASVFHTWLLIVQSQIVFAMHVLAACCTNPPFCTLVLFKLINWLEKLWTRFAHVLFSLLILRIFSYSLMYMYCRKDSTCCLHQHLVTLDNITTFF